MQIALASGGKPKTRAIRKLFVRCVAAVVLFMVSKLESSKTGSEPNFCMIPQDDLRWKKSQKPSVKELFDDCWLSDPYGSRWMQLSTKLKPSALREAKKQLSEQGLFVFKRETSIRDSRSTVCWLVQNLHGSRVKDFWKDKDATHTAISATHTAISATHTAISATHTAISATHTADILPETQTQQAFQKPSTSPQYRLNNASVTPHGVTEAVVATSIPQETEAALGGQLPTNGGMPEEETPQGATECATASGAEEIRIESPSLPDQPEVAGGEQKDLGEDQRSAANEKDSHEDEEKSRLVEEIYQLAEEHRVRCTAEERQELFGFSLIQIEVVLDKFQKALAKRGASTTTQRFQYALRIGRYWHGKPKANPATPVEASSDPTPIVDTEVLIGDVYIPVDLIAGRPS